MAGHTPWTDIKSRKDRKLPATAQKKTRSSSTKPRRSPPRPKKRAEKTQSELRDELFSRGSTFKRTERLEIVGIDNVLGEIEDIIHWLAHSHEYGEYGSRLQPGVIFEGKPGTGKTLVSRYIATQSKALFINCRDFPHKDSLFRDNDIRDLFRRARKAYDDFKQPVVLFWDEFENVAKERGDSGTTAEQEAVVSQLTAELDGVHGKNAGILLIGCTNYINYIDGALKRRGRMGLHIEFHAPDRAGKEKILNHYLSGMNTEGDIDTETLSYFFQKSATAADIEEACVEAWRLAVGRCLRAEAQTTPVIHQHDLIQVFIKQLVGPPTTYTLPEEERMSVAVHEVGHAIVSLIFGVPLRLITVQPGKKSLGRVMNDDLQEYISTQDEFVNFMRVGMAGLAAELAAGLAPMVGCTGDIQMVNETAANLVDRMTYGDETGAFFVGGFVDVRKHGYTNVIPYVSEDSIAASDRDVRKLVQIVEADANRVMMNVGKDDIWKIAHEVNNRTTLTGVEFEELFVEITDNQPEHYNYFTYDGAIRDTIPA